MASKTQTKTEIRNNTAKIGKLLRGIDNETLAIKRDHDKLGSRVKAVQENARSVQTLIGGISNTALATPVKPAKVAAAKKPEAKKPAKVAAAKKPAKKLEAKKPVSKKPEAKKPAKKLEAKKPAKAVAKKPEAKKPAKVAAAKKPVAAKAEKNVAGNRPPLKKVISDIITKNGKPMGAAEIYKEVCQQFGYYSRQSLYNALKDNKSFAKNGEEYKVVESQTPSAKSAVSDSEAEDFVRKVDEDVATSTLS
jgi:hypothetical protein